MYQIFVKNTRSGKTDSCDFINGPMEFNAVMARWFDDADGYIINDGFIYAANMIDVEAGDYPPHAIVFDLNREYDRNEIVVIGDDSYWFDYDADTKSDQ
jgi:hypothetical protein